MRWTHVGPACGSSVCELTAWDVLPRFQQGLLVAAIAAGVVPLLAPLLPGRWPLLVSVAAALLALGAGLPGVHWADVSTNELPGSVAPMGTLAGPILAALGACGVAGGVGLWSLGWRIVDRAAFSRVTAGAVAACAAGVVVSLFLPWLSGYPARLGVLRPDLAAPTYTAWSAFGTADVLLCAAGVAAGAGALVGALSESRFVVLGLAILGWLTAAGTVIAPRHAAALAGPRGGFEVLAGYEPGYYVCLVCAGLMVAAALCGAILPGRPSRERRWKLVNGSARTAGPD
jgi:hypothetical protein